MKHTILAAITLLALSAPVAWGSCEANCDLSPQQVEEQSLTGRLSEAKPTNKETPHIGKVKGFTVDELPTDKNDYQEGSNSKPRRQILKPHTPEMTCTDNCN